MTASIRTRLRALQRALRREDGVDGLPGTTIIVIGLILFLFAAIQVAFYFVGQNVAQASANTAYQTARSYQTTDQEGIDAGQQILDSHSGELTGATVTITRDAATVTVTVTGQAASIVPGMPLLPITKTLTGPIERWIP